MQLGVIINAYYSFLNLTTWHIYITYLSMITCILLSIKYYSHGILLMFSLFMIIFWFPNTFINWAEPIISVKTVVIKNLFVTDVYTSNIIIAQKCLL